MGSIDEVKAALERLLAGNATDADRTLLNEASASGLITVATGEREVAVQGDITRSIVVTRTPVRAIVEIYRLGVAAEEIPNRLPHLSLAQVVDALSYYNDHPQEITRTLNGTAYRTAR
jgi:uncharacterized protein (DUF433 family)